MNSIKNFKAELIGRTARDGDETSHGIITDVYRKGRQNFAIVTYYFGNLPVRVPLQSIRTDYVLDV